jgi:hypothetical protein
MTGTLLILGDSFCEHAQYWPAEVATALGYSTDQCHVSGQAGASWWPVRQHLQYFIHNRKTVMQQLSQMIIVHPNPARINTSSEAIRANNAIPLPFKFNNTDFAEPQLASSLYYKYINDYDFHLWAEHNWFQELNTVVGTRPVLHLFATANSFDNAKILTGTKVLHSLTELSLAVNPSRTHLGNDAKLPNHFTQAHNRVFARQLVQILQGQRKDFDPEGFKQ